MLGALESIFVIIVELIFGGLAIVTQLAALESGNSYSVIVHGIAWAAEVLVSVASFFILVLFSSAVYATAGFVLGILIMVIGTAVLIKHIKS